MGNEIVDHSDIVGASPVGATPTTTSFSTQHLASVYCAKTTATRDEKYLSFRIWCVWYQILYGMLQLRPKLHQTGFSRAKSSQFYKMLTANDSYMHQQTLLFMQDLVACSMPCHYLDQWERTVIWTLTNKVDSNYIFIHENVFESAVWKMTAILPRLQCDKETRVDYGMNTQYAHARASAHQSEGFFHVKQCCVHTSRY